MIGIFYGMASTNLACTLIRYGYFVSRNFIEEIFSNSFSVSVKRIVIINIVMIIIPLLIIWNHIGFFLDDIFFSNWKYQAITAPLFIVGNARSGTTWLHRIISMDEKFTTMRTWEIIFAASVTWRKLFMLLFFLDRNLCFGISYGALLFIEKRIIGTIDVHHVSLMAAEEDEWIMMHIFLSQLVMFFFPLGGSVLNPIVQFDMADPVTFPPKLRAEIFRYYRNCIKRHLYARYGDTNSSVVFLSKNPPFTMRLQCLYDAFPDARVVCLIRDPVQSVPSMVSYISMVSHWAITFRCSVIL